MFPSLVVSCTVGSCPIFGRNLWIALWVMSNIRKKSQKYWKCSVDLPLRKAVDHILLSSYPFPVLLQDLCLGNLTLLVWKLGCVRMKNKICWQIENEVTIIYLVFRHRMRRMCNVIARGVIGIQSIGSSNFIFFFDSEWFHWVTMQFPAEQINSQLPTTQP